MMTADMKRAAREMERAKYAKREQPEGSVDDGKRRRSPRLAKGSGGPDGRALAALAALVSS